MRSRAREPHTKLGARKTEEERRTGREADVRREEEGGGGKQNKKAQETQRERNEKTDHRKERGSE